MRSISGLLTLLIFSVGCFSQEKAEGPYVPLDKKLDKQWLKSLYEKGEPKVYEGKELTYISMPCGGIGAGQTEITGDGILCFTESVYNHMQGANGKPGMSWDGAQYLNPKKPQTKIKNGFGLTIRGKNGDDSRYVLDSTDFDNLKFKGEYPVASIEYGTSKSDLPVKIVSEVFSPFIPLDVRNSANPVTVIKFSVTNTGKEPLELTLSGWIENATFPQNESKKVNIVKHESGLTGVLLTTEDARYMEGDSSLPSGQEFDKAKRENGDMCISVLSGNASFSLSSNSLESYMKNLETGKQTSTDSLSYRFDGTGSTGGGLSSTIRLKPGKTGSVTFLISWYFPNFYETAPGCPGLVGHIYNNWYGNSFDVAKYIAQNFNQLYSSTIQFKNTFFDTSLPYWLIHRISMPLSVLASGTVQLWENGRMYCYEGVGFCFGTCGHVMNFAVPIARLFPELERSVRIMQDLSENCGYSPSGRINFRGHDGANPEAEHSYASDAQSGYVLKLYREHLMSPDYSFLDSVWPKVKKIIGYHIFTDGPKLGIEPNGVLEGLQTFWDPMWYGPNPYNNTLYLAALRAAEEMAKIKGEDRLAGQYRSLFEKGRLYMTEKMWNGEYFFHLYLNGFSGINMTNGFIPLKDEEFIAQGYIDAFDKGEPTYYQSTACDAQQLFGQNWANQLGLGYILPPDKCKKAAQSIFQYNWTPNISTVYDYAKPENRICAAPGEGALINGSWPKGKPKKYGYPYKRSGLIKAMFENEHDKSDVWPGLEYEAACDMLNEGLLDEGLIVIRSLHDRYNGVKRNPWNEISGSDHYIRATQSYDVLLSLSGFGYDGPAGKISFAPRLTPEDFRCYFNGAEGWGSYAQKRFEKQQESILQVDWGKLKLKEISVEVPSGVKIQKVQLRKDKKNTDDVNFVQEGTSIIVKLEEMLEVNSSQQFFLNCIW